MLAGETMRVALSEGFPVEYKIFESSLAYVTTMSEKN